jgi:hypothetical protein
LGALESAGRLRPPRGRLSAIDPLPAADGAPSLSNVLDELRADER